MKALYPFLAFLLILPCSAADKTAPPAKPVSILSPETSEKVNRFSWSLLQQFSDSGEDNIAISPFTIRVNLLLSQKGASGNTLKELDDVLGNPDDFKKLCDRYNSDPSGGMRTVNLLAIDKKVPLLDSFKTGIPKGELRQADFEQDPEKERQLINRWITAKTSNLITDMLPPGSITSDTALVTASASVFRKYCKTPFRENDSYDSIFHGEKGKSRVIMMNDHSRWAYFLQGSKDAIVTALPYAQKQKENSFLFVIMLPPKESKLADFIKSLSWEDVAENLTKLDSGWGMINFHMPRFSIKSPLMLFKEPLVSEGVKDLFDKDNCNLSRMTRELVYVAESYHQVAIDVNETGTRAVATAADIDPFAGSLISVSANRPFVWFIYDETEKLILFCGTLTNPANIPGTSRTREAPELRIDPLWYKLKK